MKKKKKFPLQWQAFTSTLSTTMVLILLGLVVLCVLTAKNVAGAVRENLIVTITLNDEVGHSETARIRDMLKTERYVNDTKLIPAGQVLDEQIAAIGSNPEDFIGFNPYYTEIERSMVSDSANSDSLTWIVKELKKKFPEVTDINYQKDLVDNLTDSLSKITLVLLTLAGLLLMILVALINSTVRLSIYSRRFVIHTMKLVGASWGFIRRPFLARSMWIGIISAVVASAILLIGVHMAFNYDESLRQFITGESLLVMVGSVFVLGILIMLLCTYFSVNHFIKLKEHQLYER